MTPQPSDQPTIALPANPSPLSQHTHADDVVTPHAERPPAPLPLPTAEETPAAHAGVAVPGGTAATTELKTKKSKRDLAKEAKAAKAEAQKAEHIRKAEEKAAAIKAKADRKAAEAKAKDEMKRKEKEEKERRKAEKKAKKNGTSTTGTATKAVPAPVPKPTSTVAPTSSPRQKAQSMPFGTTPPPPPSSQQSVRTKASESTLKTQTQKPKFGFLGTLKKRFSGPSTSLADVSMRQDSDAANLHSMPSPSGPGVSASAQAQAQTTPKTEIRTSSMAASSFNTPPPGMDFSPISASAPSPTPTPVPVAAPLELAPVIPVHSTASDGLSLSPQPDQGAILGNSPSPSARSLAKVTSRDQTSVRSRSASLHGPRPMPSSATRPESIATQPVANANANGGFPFRPTNANTNEVVTPTTSAESSMFSNGSQSHETGNADGGSPFTSIDSRKNSLEGLERQDSTTPKASEETVQGQGQAQGQGIAA